MPKLVTLFALWGAMCSAAAAVPFDCASLPGDPHRNKDAVRFIDAGLAAITGTEKVRFSNYPQFGTAAKAYVVPGDVVVTGETRKNWICALFANSRGGTFGWLPAAALQPLPVAEEPPLAAWVGKWQLHENANIDIKIAGGNLVVSGQAFWIGSPSNVHDGELEGKGKPMRGLLKLPSPGDLDALESATNPEYVCAAKLQLAGPYLLVEDNTRCGGLNVSFTGVYRKK